MNEDEQANLSMREIAINTKRKIEALGLHVPDEKTMYGMSIDNRTVFYWSTPERRAAHFRKVIASVSEENIKVKFIDPKT